MKIETTQQQSGIDYDENEFGNEHDDYLRTTGTFIFFDERDKYGQLTGCTYARCIDCEREMTTGLVSDVGFDHERECPHEAGEEVGR